MTDVSSALKFGPEWLRALSGAPGSVPGGKQKGAMKKRKDLFIVNGCLGVDDDDDKIS